MPAPEQVSAQLRVVLRIALQALRGLLLIVALLMGAHWLTQPDGLREASGPPLLVDAEASRHQRRDTASFQAEGRAWNVNCPIVPALCAELRQRGPMRLAVWLDAPGWLAGDWIVQAREGERLWVNASEQRARFAEMRGFYNGLGLFGALGALLITVMLRLLRPSR